MNALLAELDAAAVSGRSAAQTREEAERFRAAYAAASVPSREYIPRSLRMFWRRRKSPRALARRFLAWRRANFPVCHAAS